MQNEGAEKLGGLVKISLRRESGVSPLEICGVGLWCGAIGADLSAADLTGAKITGADLTGAKRNKLTKGPSAEQVWVITR
jgi:uncharacterized protein YjbI with pentapeptide repeats